MSASRPGVAGTRPRHERSRRVPMRIWCTHSGSASARSPAAFPAICSRQPCTMTRNASSADVSLASAAVRACTGAPTSPSPARERVAALGLVRAADRQRHVLCEPLREAEQRKRIAGDDLHLDFGDRRRPAAGANRAGIDREGRRGSIRECERNGVAHEIGRELRCEQALAHGLQQHAMPRRRAKVRDIEGRTPETAFVFAARMQSGAAAGQRRALDRLQPALALAAQPQRDAVPREAQIPGVVVRAGQMRRARAAALRRRDRRMPREARAAAGAGEHARIERELEFYLGRHGIAAGLSRREATRSPPPSPAAGARRRQGARAS